MPKTMLSGVKEVIGESLAWLPKWSSYLKMGLTTGIIIPNPQYFSGNFLGAMLQSYWGGGLRGMVSAGFGEPAMTKAVVKQLWNEGRTVEPGPVILTKGGRMYSADMLVKLAEREGLNSSFIHAETVEAIGDDINKLHREKLSEAGPVGATKEAVKGVQKYYVDAATALDNYWRVGIFIDALKKGESPASAAALARKVGYDYGALTDWEKSVGRALVTFYSYMRRNQDLFWDTLLRNPHRVMGKLRLLKGQRQLLEEESEIVLPEYRQLRYIFRLQESVVADEDASGRVHGVAHLGPPMPIGDALSFFIEISELGDTDSEGTREMAGRLHPFIQAGAVAVTGVDIWSGDDIDDTLIIPPWMMEIDLNLFGGHMVYEYFGAAQVPVSSPYVQPTDYSTVRYYARKGKNYYMAKHLLGFMPGFGRSASTIDVLDRSFDYWGPVEMAVRASRAVGSVNPIRKHTGAKLAITGPGDTQGPRYGMSKAQEFAGLLGFAPTIVQTRGYGYEMLMEDESRKMDKKAAVGERSRELPKAQLENL